LETVLVRYILIDTYLKVKFLRVQLMVTRNVLQLITFMQKLFIKNTVPRTNYTQLHQLGGLGER